MQNAGFTDFLFTGLAIVPAVLLLTGYVGLAMLLFIPLLIGACLVSMYQQQTCDTRETADSSAPDTRPVLQPTTHWRERL